MTTRKCCHVRLLSVVQLPATAVLCCSVCLYGSVCIATAVLFVVVCVCVCKVMLYCYCSAVCRSVWKGVLCGHSSIGSFVVSLLKCSVVFFH